MLNAEKFRDEIFDNDNNLICDKLRDVFFRETKENEFKSLEKVVRWLLSEYKEPPILDEVEREYLSAVCKPYKVVSISKKISFDASVEWIAISVESSSNNGIESVYLPCFKSGTMYKGMKVKRAYTPQELWIKCRNNPNGEIKHENC